MKKGTELELEIERFADRGKSVARTDGFVVFVPGGVPGDRVRARIIRKKRKYAEARVIDLLSASDLRSDPRCAHFGTCGGCQWQHVDYRAQADAKRQSVVDAFGRIAGLDDLEVEPTLEAENTYGYRNKMEFSFSAARWLTEEEIASGDALDRSFALGLHVPGNFEKVLDLRECHLMGPWVSRLLNSIREIATSSGWDAWNVRTHEGYLRHLVVRASEAENEAMVNLVVSSRDDEREAAVAALLMEQFPEVSTFIVTLNRSLSQTAYGRNRTIYGSGVIHDRIGDLRFRIAPESFFQTNTQQARRLYDCVVEMADFSASDRIFDLYCGTGSIALYVARHVFGVVGVELFRESVRAARTNAAENGIANALFEIGDVTDLIGPLVEKHGAPDMVIVDPPRPGLHPKAVAALGSLAPGRIVYVSCNPQTMARDIGMLGDAYRVDRVRPVDMFPHTHHIEAVARLTRKA